MPNASDDVGLVLVTYGSSEDLPQFLASLPDAVEPLPLEVVGIDNGSRDDSADLVAAFGAEVVRNVENVGLTRALNQGARELETEWLVVINPDTRLEPGSIAQLVRTAQTDPRIGLIGPLVTRLDGTPYPTGRRFPSVTMGIAHAVLGVVWPNNPATRAYWGDGAPSEVTDADWVSGCCMLFRRAAFEAVGGFDERYFMYFEETKIALDLHRAGWRVAVDPGATIRHREGGSTRHQPLRKVLNHHRSALRFFRDYHHGSPWLLGAPLVAAGLILRGAAALAWTAIRGRVSTASRGPELDAPRR